MCSAQGCLQQSCLQTGPFLPFLEPIAKWSTNRAVREEEGRGGVGRRDDGDYRYEVKRKGGGSRHSSSFWQAQHLGGPRQEDGREFEASLGKG